MNTKNKFKIAINLKSSQGFTLIELLVAIIMSGIVVSGAGFGLISIMNASSRTDTETQTRLGINRALEHIANDIREARTVQAYSGGGLQGISITKPNIAQPTIYAFSSTSSQPLIKAGTILKTYNGSSSILVGGLVSSASPSCGGTLAGNGGFRVCITSNNRVAHIYLYGRGNNNEVLQVNTRAFARSAP